MTQLTKVQAQAIIDAHDIYLEEDDEDTILLRRNNPVLYTAYKALLSIADVDEDPSGPCLKEIDMKGKKKFPPMKKSKKPSK